MSHDPCISEAMWARIDRELAAIEQQHHVRILFAVESGSRAWRFPSIDSDYDVRFVYAHAAAAYLSIEPPDDVIERPTDGILDVNGWDVRKLLQLLVRSNAVVLEWLTSSIRYRDGGPIAAQLLALARETCYLPALAYHYDRLARNSFGEITSSPGAVRFRAYCYALRPALALLWVRRGEAPPMDLWSLLAGVAIPEALRHTVAEFVERKAAADERGMTARLPRLDAFLDEVLSEPENRFVLPEREAVRLSADELFRSILRLSLSSD
jgi:hypothetical protein